MPAVRGMVRLPDGRADWLRAACVDFALVAAVALVPRLLYVALMPAEVVSNDTMAWQWVASLLDDQRNPYVWTDRLNWPPLWMQVVYLIDGLASRTGLPFRTALQFSLIGLEILLLLSACLLFRRLQPGDSPRSALLWGIALNPICVFLVCQHCNFDVLLGIWLLLFATSMTVFAARGSPQAWLWSCCALGLAILTKTVALILLPLLVHRWRRIPATLRLLGGVMTLGPVTLGMSILYVLHAQAITENVLQYRSYGGYFGISGLMRILGLEEGLSLYGDLYAAAVVGGMIGLAVLLARRRVRPRAMLLMMTLLLMSVPALGPGYQPQYAYWFIPLLIQVQQSRRGLRKAALLFWIVAVPTYLIEYATFFTHGAFLLHLMPGEEARRLCEALFTPESQTLLRMPLFMAYMLFLGAGTRQLVREVRRDEGRGESSRPRLAGRRAGGTPGTCSPIPR